MGGWAGGFFCLAFFLILFFFPLFLFLGAVGGVFSFFRSWWCCCNNTTLSPRFRKFKVRAPSGAGGSRTAMAGETRPGGREHAAGARRGGTRSGGQGGWRGLRAPPAASARQPVLALRAVVRDGLPNGHRNKNDLLKIQTINLSLALPPDLLSTCP